MERTHYRSVSSRTLVYMYRPIRLMYIRLRINHVTPMSGAYTIHYTRGVRARYREVAYLIYTYTNKIRGFEH